MNAFVLKLLIGGSLLLGVVVYIHQLRGTIANQQTEISDLKTSNFNLKTIIRNMTEAQNTQTTATERVVTKVVQGPETVRTVIKTVHDTPVPQDCLTPDYPQNVRDQF